MSKAPLQPEDFESFSTSSSEVVQRKDDEVYHVVVSSVSSMSVSCTKARTYAREAGHYFVAESDSRSEVSELDTLLNDVKAKRGLINMFQRNPGETYEIYVEAVAPDDAGDIAESYKSDELELLFSPDSEEAQSLDEVLSEISSVVSD